MKFHQIVLYVIVLVGVAVAQNHAETKKAATPKLDAQGSFDSLKNLAGTWTGPVTFYPDPPPGARNGQPLQVLMHVTSRGNALVHEIPPLEGPDDPTRNDHPVTMLYLDGDRLTLVHYCDAGNRPRMVARKSPDGKTVEFDFVDISGSTQYGHMHHAVFTIVDANHHTEDWTYVMPDDKPMRAHFDLKRLK